jgi:ketosteroid isomerase-like protein
MTKQNAQQFAETWVNDWNRRDVEAVLSHFDDEVVFISPKAQQIVGRAEMRGKAELRNYWQTALAQIQELNFKLDRVIVDGDAVAIVYWSRLNGKTTHAIESFTMNQSGLAVRGEAFYGTITSAQVE